MISYLWLAAPFVAGAAVIFLVFGSIIIAELVQIYCARLHRRWQSWCFGRHLRKASLAPPPRVPYSLRASLARHGHVKPPASE